MIIGLGGRKGSGKSLLSSYLVDKGFVKISFADPLKKILSILYDIPIQDFYSQVKKDNSNVSPWKWDNKKADELSNLTQLNIICKKEKSLFSIREMLQFIGTDIIRKIDPQFHVNKLLSSIDMNNTNYICDDFRFKNELDALKSYGAHSFYLVRPNNFDISNHISETNLKWKDFDYIIYNDVNLKSFTGKFIKIINYIDRKINFKKLPISDKNSLEKLLIDNNYNINQISQKIKCDKSTITKWCANFGIHLSRNNKYSYDHSAFYIADEAAAYYAGLLSADGCIKKSGYSKYKYVIDFTSMDRELVDGLKRFVQTNKPIYIRKSPQGKDIYNITIHSSLIIENIKHWNLKPNKSKYNEIPSIIENNQYLLKYWFLGLIDGDGNIRINKQNKYKIPLIRFLASEQIVDFAIAFFKGKGIKCCKYPEKGIDNLFCLTFNGKNAIKLYNMIYDKKYALSRKWNIITEYIS